MGEGHCVDLPDGDARRSEAELDRLVREGLRVLLAVEPLLFDEADRHPVPQQGGGGVVGEAVDPEDVHRGAMFPDLARADNRRLQRRGGPGATPKAAAGFPSFDPKFLAEYSPIFLALDPPSFLPSSPPSRRARAMPANFPTIPRTPRSRRRSILRVAGLAVVSTAIFGIGTLL